MFTRYLDFQGRIGRMEYFLNALKFWGMFFILAFVIGIFAALMPSRLHSPALWVLFAIPAFCLFTYATCRFGWSQGAKRAHDLGHSGWIQLVTLIPFVGWLLSLYLLFAPGQEHDNAFGVRNSG